MTRITSVTNGQKFPTVMLSYRLVSEIIPTSERSALATICILSAQLRPLRIISPKSTMPQATGHATTNKRTIRRVGSRPGTLARLDWLKRVRIGTNAVCTANPQSKATAMPIPCGAGSSFIAVSLTTGSCVSKAGFSFILLRLVLAGSAWRCSTTSAEVIRRRRWTPIVCFTGKIPYDSTNILRLSFFECQ